jgi:hypothetical protein
MDKVYKASDSESDWALVLKQKIINSELFAEQSAHSELHFMFLPPRRVYVLSSPMNGLYNRRLCVSKG